MPGSPPAPVTVVVPAYNDAAWIGDAIASVLTQTRRPAEIIVVDDGSTDETAARVRDRFGSTVRLISRANGGPSRARNTGIEAAGQPYVAFLDADDVWVPTKLERQLAVLDADPAIGVVATDWVRTTRELPAAVPTLDALPVSRISYADLLALNRFQTSTVLARTSRLREVGGFDPAVDGAEDWDLWVRLAQVTGVVKLDWPFVVYRDRESGYSKDVWRVYETMRVLLDKHRESAPMSRAGFRELEAWHHLRFFVALALMRDRVHARAALRAAFRNGLWPYALEASVTRLLPFLYGRVRRRTPR